jgi:hypothetical protein
MPGHPVQATNQTNPPLEKNSMDHLIEQCSGIAGAKPVHRTFQIVIVYENLVSAARALRACEFLRGEIGGAVSLDVNVWKMAVLADGDSRRGAALAAAQADVVIVSASGREEIPDAFRLWVEAWLGMDHGARPAVFTLFGEHIGDGALSVASFLRGKTSMRGIDFFCHPPLDTAGLQRAPALQPALEPGQPLRDIDPAEWRPGQKGSEAWMSPHSAFDAIEDFAAHLRARLSALAPNWNSRDLEEWKTRFTRQELVL